METRNTLIAAIFAIFWATSASYAVTVPLSGSMAEGISLQGLYAGTQLDLPVLDGQTLAGPALAPAHPPEDIIHFGLDRPNSTWLAGSVLRGGAVNGGPPGTLSGSVYANSFLPEVLAGVDRPASELQSSGEPATAALFYNGQPSSDFATPGGFGIGSLFPFYEDTLYLPYGSSFLPYSYGYSPYSYWYSSNGYWGLYDSSYADPFVDHHHRFTESAAAEASSSAIPEPATLALLGSGALILLRKRK